MWLQVLYHVSYRLINSFHDYLRALPHRVYICATHGSSGCYRDLTDPLVDQYIQLQRDYLLLRRTADFDNDKAPPRCLWPRVELVPQVQIAKAKRFHCRFTFAVVGDPEDYRAVVFQLAETEYSNSPPSSSCRYATVSCDSDTISLHEKDVYADSATLISRLWDRWMVVVSIVSICTAN